LLAWPDDTSQHQVLLLVTPHFGQEMKESITALNDGGVPYMSLFIASTILKTVRAPAKKYWVGFV